MPSDSKRIGKEILKELEIYPTRLGEALSTLNTLVRDCLERYAWNEVPVHCESAYELCDAMHGSEESREWSSVIDLFHAEGIFHAYEGISHLYQAEESRGKENLSEETEELARAIDCLKESQRSFHVGYRDQWNESIICLGLGRICRSQDNLEEALLAFQRSCIFSDFNFNRLSIERMQEIQKVASIEIERTRRLLGDQKPFAPGELRELPPPMQHKVIPSTIPVIGEIAAGKEKPVSDDIIGYMRQTDEFEFEFEGQALKVEPLRRSQLAFPPEYGYVVVVQVLGDSMDQAGIAPNDYVILQKPRDVPLKPSPGDIVAVVFRDENNKATLKRFYFDKSSGNVTLKTESSNPEHKTRVLRPEDFVGDNPPVAVVGCAIAVLKPSLPTVDRVEARKGKPASEERIPQETGERLLREAKYLLQETKKLLQETKEMPQETKELLLQENKELLQEIKRLPKGTEERLLQEAKDLLQETKDLLQGTKGPPQEAKEPPKETEKHLPVESDRDAFFGDLWSQFVNLADAVVILDPERSKKVIDPLKEKLSKALNLINGESKPEEWVSLVDAVSNFYQYSSSTEANRTIEKLRQLVVELVSKIIAKLSNYKHLTSITEQLNAMVRQLQHL